MIKWWSQRDMFVKGYYDDFQVYFDMRRGMSLRTSFRSLAILLTPMVRCWFTFKQTPWMPYEVYKKVPQGTDLTCFSLLESMRMMDK